MDHSDGLPWATLVFNAVAGNVPKQPREGAYYPSLKDKPRFYERFSQAFAFVPRIAPFRSDIAHIDPNQRLFPSQHTFDPNRFAGTLLSAVDIVWFPEKGHASKSDYADWAGSIDQPPPPRFGIHQYTNDVVPGYYVKLDSSELNKYTVLYVYRPLKRINGEPEIVVREINNAE